MNTDKKIIIALDGFSSSGKSTMAKALARRIGYRYVDTGAMYRAVTLWAMEHSLVDTGGNVNAEALAEALPSIEIGFTIMPDGTQHTTLGGTDVERRIRSMEVSSNVSAVAAIPAVRHALVAMQQAFGKEKGIVMDGRHRHNRIPRRRAENISQCICTDPRPAPLERTPRQRGGGHFRGGAGECGETRQYRPHSPGKPPAPG